MNFSITGASDGFGSTYQWADGVEASGWYASDLSDYMFNGNLNSFAKAETSGTDYLGWNKSGTSLPTITGPVEIYLAYADVGNYTYLVNGSSVTPTTTGAADSGAWITISSGDVNSFRVTAPSSSSNVQIAGVKSNGLLLTPTTLYSGDNSISWSGTMEYSSVTDIVDETVASITVTDPLDSQSIVFDSTKVLGFDGDYVTFRNQNTTDQFPITQSGYSLDLWSDTLRTDLITNSISWQTLDGNSYTLNSNKWSLAYDYGSPRAIRFSKSGTISFSIQT